MKTKTRKVDNSIEMYLTGVGFDRSFVMTPNFDFCTEKTQTVEELIYKLGHKLSELEDNDGEVIISDREYDIDKSIIFISGVINYSHEDSLGDYFTPSSSKRKFIYADLEVNVYFDENDEEGRFLTSDELDILYKAIKY